MNSQAVLMRMFVILGMVSLAFLAGCGGGTSQAFNNQLPPPTGSNPTPTITTISPISAVGGGAAFTLTINGTNFVAGSIVNFAGTARTTSFVNATQLTAAISAAAIALDGYAEVTVTNPGPGAGTADRVWFTIIGGTNPVPTINSLDSSGTPVGGQAFTLTVYGLNFVASSVVRWNGSNRPTTLVVSWCCGPLLTAQIPASDIAAAGTASITVFNPAPGGGTSSAMNFTVTGGGTTNPATWISLAVAPDSSGKFGKFAYLTNSSSNNVTIYSIDPATGSLTARGSIPAGTSPQSVAVDHSGKFAYVANGNSNDISMYAINSTTGALETLGTVVAGKSPISVVIDPSGKFTYVANEGSNDISIFAIMSTGTLDPLGPIAAGVVPTSVTVGPFGGFAYVTNANPNGPFEVNTSNGNISTYKVNSTGALEPSGTVAAGLYPRSIAVDPSGKFVYVANCGDFERNQGDIAMYTVDASTGTLTLIGTVGAGSCPLSVALHPSGKFAYAANTGSDGRPDIEGVSMYTINPNGTLTPMGLINAGYCPSSLAVDPSGKFAYVTNHCDNTISMYTIDLTTGALTLLETIGT